MNAPTRQFTAALATREHVPLLIGLMGPSGGGKTFSALRLATGIQKISGGEIFMVDTEARRGLHYADNFKFRHLQFDAPFGSLDYLAAIKWCVDQGAGVVIVDSMSHEHEGPGGLLDLQDQELRRLAGDDYGTWKADKYNMLAWQKPKAARRKFINGLLQLNCNFIFCFRAKETSKPIKKENKTVIESMGFMPIAGDEFVFEMTMNALLLPNAGGKPTWQSEQRGERMMMKLPEQFRSLLDDPRPMDERLGEALALWARGNAPPASSGVSAGGPTSKSQTSAPMPLSERVAMFKTRIAGAPDLTKLRAMVAASAVLRADVEAQAPELLQDMDDAVQARRTALGGVGGEPPAEPEDDATDPKAWAGQFEVFLAAAGHADQITVEWEDAKAKGIIAALQLVDIDTFDDLVEKRERRIEELRAA